MLFTRETDYAIRFFRTLIDGQLHSVSEITETEYVPPKYAYKIVHKLSKAGLIEVLRGSKGGCRLKKDLAKVSLYELIMIMEPRKEFVACLDPEYECPYREEHRGCRVHSNLSVVEKKLSKELKKISIKEILEENLKKV